jgi:hypothetical protein
MLKLFVYGYLNRVQSSRRLKREAQRNLELMWLTGRLAPDFKTIADFRKDTGEAIHRVCSAEKALDITPRTLPPAWNPGPMDYDYAQQLPEQYDRGDH